MANAKVGKIVNEDKRFAVGGIVVGAVGVGDGVVIAAHVLLGYAEPKVDGNVVVVHALDAGVVAAVVAVAIWYVVDGLVAVEVVLVAGDGVVVVVVLVVAETLAV